MVDQSIQLSEVDLRVEKALRLRAGGKSWSAIGDELNTDSGNLYRACVARGYKSEQKSRRAYFAALHAEIADEAGRQLLERLQNGEVLTSKELAVVGGISTDKVRDAEGWSRQEADDGASWLAALAKRLPEGQSVKLEVSKPRTVDVTPGRPPESAD